VGQTTEKRDPKNRRIGRKWGEVRRPIFTGKKGKWLKRHKHGPNEKNGERGTSTSDAQGQEQKIVEGGEGTETKKVFGGWKMTGKFRGEKSMVTGGHE